MNVNSDQLVLRGKHVIHGRAEDIGIFYDGAMKLLNQSVTGVGDLVAHVNSDSS